MSINSLICRGLQTFLIAFAALALTTSDSLADVTCSCKVSQNNISGLDHQNPDLILLDLTGAVNKQYNNRNQGNQQRCQTDCSNAALANKNQVATVACSAGVPGGTTFHAYAALGNSGNKSKYESAQAFGALVNTQAVTETACTCPQDWTPNAPKITSSVFVSGLHYPTQSCAQSRADFEGTMLTSFHFTSRCSAPNKLVAASGASCQDQTVG